MELKQKPWLRMAMLCILCLMLSACTSITGQKISPMIKSGQELTFFVTTDIHYLADNLRDNGAAFRRFVDEGDGKQLDDMNEIMDAFVYDIRKKKPEVLLISGDLTNNGELESHKELSERLREIEEGGTSIYVIPGNHDIMNPWARGFAGDKQYVTPSISDKDFSKIYGDFGYNEAISMDRDTLSYLAAPSEDIWLLMLDTNQYRKNPVIGAPQTDGRISTETYDWIAGCNALAKKNGAYLVTVMHHNLINHSEVIREGYTLNDNQEALNYFAKSGISFTLSGHIHIQDISSYEFAGKEQSKPGKIYDIATSSLSVYPQQYGILQYKPDQGLFDYSTSWIDMEGWAKDQGIKDERLLNFREYSRNFFGERAYKMAYRYLKENDNYRDEEKMLMAETMKALNLNYFAGTESAGLADKGQQEGLKLWNAAEDGFMKRYIMSIGKDHDMEDNQLMIPILIPE